MKNYQSRKSISVIGLLVTVVTLTLLTAACGKKAGSFGNEGGGQRESSNVANETEAVQSLKAIFQAQMKYKDAHSGRYGQFDDLVKEAFLEKRYSGNVPGYVFKMKVTDRTTTGRGEETEFRINANPEGMEALGARYLYMDSTSDVVHVNAKRAAWRDDPPVDP